MSRPEAIVIHLDNPEDTAGWPCPSCGGLGTRLDGWVTFGLTQIVIQPASKCCVCRGLGRVNVSPLSTAEQTP